MHLFKKLITLTLFKSFYVIPNLFSVFFKKFKINSGPNLFIVDVLALAWIEQPADTNSVIGGDAEFICNFSGASLSTWTRPGGTLFVNNVSMTTDSRFSITGHFNLHIRNVKKEDQGEYTCSVQNLQPVGKGYLNVYSKLFL